MTTQKNKFTNASILEAMLMVRAGFELETQLVDGRTVDEWACESEVDYERMSDQSYEDWCARWRSECKQFRAYAKAINIGEIVLNEAGLPILKDTREKADFGVLDFKETLDLLMENFVEIAEVAPAALDKKLDQILDKFQNSSAYDELEQSERESIEENYDYSGFSVPGEDGIDQLREEYGRRLFKAKLEMVTDSSVDGPEIRTCGALTLKEFRQALKVATGLPIEVDTGCSFHIHLSIPEVKHSYGRKLQALMYEYLISSIDRVPESVRDRWNNDYHYFKPELSTDKYSFVHFHHQGTWEFRCFGNVDNEEDGMQCLRLAVEALQYAYKVIAGVLPMGHISRILLDKEYNVRGSELLDVGMSGSYSLRKTLKSIRTEKHRRTIKEQQAA